MRKFSLSLRFVILFLVIIVPLNFFAVFSSYNLIQDAEETKKADLRFALETAMAALDVSVQDTNRLLYDYPEHDEDCLVVLSRASRDLDYLLSRRQLQQRLSRTLSFGSSHHASVFFYRSDLEDLLLVTYQNASPLEEFLWNHQLLDTSLSPPSGWQLIDLSGRPLLFRRLVNGSCVYGAFLDLTEAGLAVSRLMDQSAEISGLSWSTVSPVSENVLFAASNVTSLFLSLTYDPASLRSAIASWRWTNLLLILILLPLSVLLYFLLRRMMLSPLMELSHAHNELRSGNEDYRIHRKASSWEIVRLYDSFNHMADGLKQMRIDKENREEAYNKMILNNLQLQIRPHFLHNIFGLLYSMIHTGNTDAAKKTILYISEYFRNLFQYQEELVPFPREIQLVRDYLEIAAIQYPEEFVFRTDFDPEIEQIHLPPLLLHNFVENIISHGLVHGRTVEIMMTGTWDDGLVTFMIADDGCGMSVEEAALINSANYAGYTRGKHVGLRNSIARLRYFYPEGTEIHVDSAPGEGTVFTISFRYEGVIDDESADGE